MSNVKCPECKEVVNFRNIIQVDDKKVELLGIVYMFRCKKCDTTFIPEMRHSKKAGKSQMKKIAKDLKEKLERIK